MASSIKITDNYNEAFKELTTTLDKLSESEKTISLKDIAGLMTCLSFEVGKAVNENLKNKEIEPNYARAFLDGFISSIVSSLKTIDSYVDNEKSKDRVEA